MKKIIKYNLIALLALVFFISSCDDEDYSGYTKLNPTSPTITVSGTGSFSLTEAVTAYTFDVTLSEAQVADISIYVTQTGGDATMGEDFEISNTNNRVYIPANSTTGKLEIKVLQDDLKEETETFTLTIGDERTTNADLNPVDVTWTIDNYTTGDLDIAFSWETDVLDVVGLDIEATEAVDLRMLIVNPSDYSILATIDGAGFESFNTVNDTLDDGTYMTDGTYLIATDIFSTVEFGDYDEVLTLGVTLDFYQTGVYNNVQITTDNAFTNQYICSNYRVYLASVTKTGDTYTFEDAFEVPYHPLAGEWQGTDAVTPYSSGESEVEVVLGCSLDITGIGFNWLTEFWGEEIIAGGTILFDVNLTSGTINIPNQYYCTTVYDGDVQDDYNIFGSGTVDMSGDYPTMHITYELENYGVNWGDWCYNEGYITTPTFEADLTLDPAGLKAAINGESVKFDLKNKPVH